MIELDGRQLPDTIVPLPFEVVLEESGPNVKRLKKAYVGSGRGVFER